MERKGHLHRTGRRLAYSGAVLDFYRDRMVLPDGKEEEWDFLSHKKGGGACAVPVLPDGRILLIRQLRPVIDRKTWELPAGARDHQEDPSVTAARELFEETGYRAGRITPLIVLKTAPAWCDEETHVYLAEDLTREGDQCLDEAEEIDMAAFPLPELLARIRSGELQDAKTVAGILMYAQIRGAET